MQTCDECPFEIWKMAEMCKHSDGNTPGPECPYVMLAAMEQSWGQVYAESMKRGEERDRLREVITKAIEVLHLEGWRGGTIENLRAAVEGGE